MEDQSIILETERLQLRRQRASDTEFLVSLWADPKVTAFLGGPREPAWLRAVFQETAQNPNAEKYDLWPLVEKLTAQPIGHCGLLEKEVEGSPEVELNYILTPSAWGRGYGTEIAKAIAQYAFLTLGLARLIALIEPANEASRDVATKVGMRLERQVHRPDGALRLLYLLEIESPAAMRGTVRRC